MDKWFDPKFEKNRREREPEEEWKPYESDEDPFSDNNLHNNNDFRKTRNKKVLIIIIGIIVLLCVVLAYDFNGTKTFIKENIGQNKILGKVSLNNPSTSSPEERNEFSTCEKEYKEALYVRERKYNLDSKFLESEEVDNYEDASRFLNTWKTPNIGGVLDYSEKELLKVKNYPIIMLASSLEQDLSIYGAGGFYTTSVSYCDKEGYFFFLKK